MWAAEIINLGFWSERRFQGSSYGELLPVSSPQQTSPLGAWASPMSPLSWPEAAGAINSVFTPTLTNVPSPPKGWKINPGNRSILAHGGERERAGGAAHFHTNQSRNQRRSLDPDQMGNRAGVLLEFLKKTLILFSSSDQDQSWWISCIGGQIVLLCYMLITSGEDVDLFLCFLQLEARGNKSCVLGGAKIRRPSFHCQMCFSVISAFLATFLPNMASSKHRRRRWRRGNHDFSTQGWRSRTCLSTDEINPSGSGGAAQAWKSDWCCVQVLLHARLLERGPVKHLWSAESWAKNPKLLLARPPTSFTSSSKPSGSSADVTGGGCQDFCLHGWQTAQTRPGNNEPWLFQFGDLKEGLEGWDRPAEGHLSDGPAEVPLRELAEPSQNFPGSAAAFCQRSQPVQNKPTSDKFTRNFQQSFCLVWFARLYVNF